MSVPHSRLPRNHRRNVLYVRLYAAILVFVSYVYPPTICAENWEEPIQSRIVDVQVGFKPIPDGAATPTHKVGLWTPVFVTVLAGGPENKLRVETSDNEGFNVVSTKSIPGSAQEQTHTLYVKPGNLRGEVRVTLLGNNDKQIATVVKPAATSELGDYLYLSLGAKLDALADALVFKEKRAAEESKTQSRPTRFAVHGDTIGSWQGLDGIDLVILSTGTKGLNEIRLKDEIPPLLDWVQRGGRLVVPVHPERAFALASTFRRDHKARAAQPPFLAKNLISIESWSGLQNKPFPARGEPPVPVAQLDLADFGFDSWEVQAQLDDKTLGGKSLPLIARAPFGFGSVTFIAFPLDTGAFTRWSGQVEFLRTLVDQIGPRYVAADAGKSPSWETQSTADWGAQLQRDLDNFDVPVFSFGTVAFLMFVYIIVVSAADQLFLRKLVGRLEATWVTLPLIVAGVSLATYWVVNSPHDHGVRVNQIDLLDFDFRMPILHPNETDQARALLDRGSTFFNVRSDRICRLSASIDAASTVDDGRAANSTISWFGRPDDGPGGIGRAGGQTLSARSYSSIEHDSKLVDIPLAFRATKSLTAEWLRNSMGQPNIPPKRDTKPAFAADLVYHSRDSALKVSGTIANHLPFDLEEASLFLFDRVYPLEGGLKKGEVRKIEIRETDNGSLPTEWKNRRDPNRPAWALGPYDPGIALRNILFHERLDPTLKVRNHLLRRLDWSWRLRDDPRMVNVPLSSLGTQETILVGRAKFQEGDAKTLLEGPHAAVRVSLESQENGPREWRETGGKLARDVYVRAIFPMKPKGQ